MCSRRVRARLAALREEYVPTRVRATANTGRIAWQDAICDGAASPAHCRQAHRDCVPPGRRRSGFWDALRLGEHQLIRVAGALLIARPPHRSASRGACRLPHDFRQEGGSHKAACGKVLRIGTSDSLLACEPEGGLRRLPTRCFLVTPPRAVPQCTQCHQCHPSQAPQAGVSTSVPRMCTLLLR